MDEQLFPKILLGSNLFIVPGSEWAENLYYQSDIGTPNSCMATPHNIWQDHLCEVDYIMLPHNMIWILCKQYIENDNDY